MRGKHHKEGFGAVTGVVQPCQREVGDDISLIVIIRIFGRITIDVYLRAEKVDGLESVPAVVSDVIKVECAVT
jgi:hypothetical protein